MPIADENMALAQPMFRLLTRVAAAPAAARSAMRPAVAMVRRALMPARAWLIRLALAALACSTLAPRAWDADTMLRAAQAQGPQALAGARALQLALAGLSGQDDAARLAAVNQFFNRRVVFASDAEVWGQTDYWASPLETLAKGRGDCEDYVIAKYFSLVAMGMPVARLRLVYVRAQVGGPGGAVLAHMVLAYYAAAGAEPLILDNLIGEIRPASRRPDLEPVFSFNGEGLWQGVGTQSAGDPVSRTSG